MHYSCKFYEDLRLSKLKNKLAKNSNKIKLNQRAGRIPVLKAGEVCAGAGSLRALWLVLVSTSILRWVPLIPGAAGSGTRGPTFRLGASFWAWINPIQIAPQRKICMFWRNNLETQPIKVHTQLCVEQMLKKVNFVQMQR